MLRLCGYPRQDICCVLAHASAYFSAVFESVGVDMDNEEAGNVLVLLMYIAHSYVNDETCPLKLWHKHLFRNYCTVKTLDLAITRLLELRGYMLRLSDRDLARRMDHLAGSLPAGVL